MKSILLFAMSLLIGSSVIAQKLEDKDVPANVKASFQKNYPNVANVTWRKAKENYKARFDNTGIVIDASGNIVETQLEINANELPQAVHEYLQANFKNEAIVRSRKITDTKGAITFMAEVKEHRDLFFDSNGKFVKEVKD